MKKKSSKREKKKKKKKKESIDRVRDFSLTGYGVQCGASLLWLVEL